MSRKLLIVISIISILAFTSSALSVNVSTLLEKGIYVEETKGDLDEAMMIYQKIINENTGNSANIAEAYYRLGTCYLKTGDDEKAIEMFKELLTRFREHEEIASDARTQLLKLNALDEEEKINEPLELGPVPWEAGETCWHNINDPKGGVIGKIFESIKEIRTDGNDLWQIEGYLYIPIIGGLDSIQKYWRSDVLKESFIPVSSIVKGNITTGVLDIKAIYKEDHIQFINTAKEKKFIPVGNIVCDNIQEWKIIRRLPLTQNYSTSFNYFDLHDGKIKNEILTVTGKEAVTVPEGTYECYCLWVVNFDFPYKTKMWISADDKKYVVKMEMQGITNELESVTFELEKVTYGTVDERVVFNDSEFGISMTAPEEWHFVKGPKPAPFKMDLQIVTPELKARSSFSVAQHSAPIPTLQTIKAVMGKFLNNYTPRPESWVYGEIDGLPSLTYIADYDKEGVKMVNYRLYVNNIQEQKLGVFDFYLEKESFNEMKTYFDSIVQSFKWKKK